MSRKKKPSKDPWVNFIRALFARKRRDRRYKLPTDYILSVADKLHRVNPSLEITYNTLVDVYTTGYEDGYERKGEDVTWFTSVQKKHMDEDFNAFKDMLDDAIHNKESNQNKK